MGLNATLKSLANTTATVTRRAAGAYDASGRWVQSSTVTTFQTKVAIQPATGQPQVINGRNQMDTEQGEYVTDVRTLRSLVEIRTRTPTNDPDILSFTDGELVGDWVVFRVLHWNLRGQIHWEVTITRKTGGAS